MKSRSSLACALSILLAGCAEGAHLVQDNANGGVVIYPFKGPEGAMLSPFRKEALAIIQEKCGSAYSIVREGETKGRTRIAGAVEGAQEIVRERRWGIEFRCK